MEVIMLKKKIPKTIFVVIILCILSITVITSCESPVIYFTGKWVYREDQESGKTIKSCEEGGRECAVVGAVTVNIPDYLADLLE